VCNSWLFTLQTHAGLPVLCPRGKGFWSNHPEIWDADASNDASFAWKDGFPDSDILLLPYYNGTAGERG